MRRFTHNRGVFAVPPLALGPVTRASGGEAPGSPGAVFAGLEPRWSPAGAGAQ